MFPYIDEVYSIAFIKYSIILSLRDLELRKEGIAVYEIISRSCLRLLPDKMKIGYKLKIVSIIYAKCRCLPRITMLSEICLEIRPTVMTLLCY